MRRMEEGEVAFDMVSYAPVWDKNEINLGIKNWDLKII